MGRVYLKRIIQLWVSVSASGVVEDLGEAEEGVDDLRVPFVHPLVVGEVEDEGHELLGASAAHHLVHQVQLNTSLSMSVNKSTRGSKKARHISALSREWTGRHVEPFSSRV